jgi:hypothetical protein
MPHRPDAGRQAAVCPAASACIGVPPPGVGRGARGGARLNLEWSGGATTPGARRVRIAAETHDRSGLVPPDEADCLLGDVAPQLSLSTE